LSKGEQGIVICPVIEGSEEDDLKNVLEMHKKLTRLFAPRFHVGLIHGRIAPDQKDQVMEEFRRGKIDLLVGTSVIEVGVHAPGATMMVIEHPERFGLSQLHQLRGRVGRGQHASQCLLIAYPSISEDGKARLDAIQKSTDGFVIAEQDLKIRGPGDFMGTRQSGMPILRVANLLRDIKILEAARKEAFQLLDRDPDLKQPEHQNLKRAMKSYLGDKLNLLNII
jgi:ATP-dependent DNA helicase RecG